jgi:hypothetical protein
MAHDVFISYASEDKITADAVCARLESHRIRCWIAPRDVLPGMDYGQALVEAIKQSRLVVLVFSARSNASPHVRREVERAVAKGIPVLPLRIEDVPLSPSLEYFLHKIHWLDALTRPVEKHLEQVAETVRLIMSGQPPASGPPAEAPAAQPPLGPTTPPDAYKTPPRRRPIGPLARLSRVFGQGGHARTDPLHFSVTSPPAVHPGAHFVMDVWAHLQHQRDAVMQRAKEALGAGVHLQSKGPVQVAGGTLISVLLRLEGLTIEDPEDFIVWTGEAANAAFLVAVPDDALEGPRAGLASIYMDALQIAKIPFVVLVSRAPADDIPLLAGGHPHRRAFASYASADRDEVLGRVQGMQKAAPQLDVFLDVLSLRSGQDWEQELWRVIPSKDIFYLFWSRNASQSEWVEKEWRCALEARGLEFIDPVPLVSPDVVPPPPELASRYFNDWILAFKRGERQA